MIKMAEVNSSRGAPMGRRSEELEGEYIVEEMEMIDGDYDNGGAYWGCGGDKTGWMFVAEDSESRQDYLRAQSLEDAQKKFKNKYPEGALKIE